MKRPRRSRHPDPRLLAIFETGCDALGYFTPRLPTEELIERRTRACFKLEYAPPTKHFIESQLGEADNSAKPQSGLLPGAHVHCSFEIDDEAVAKRVGLERC
jgi:hypothetical protein